MTKSHSYDVLVIGSGPGGQKAAVQAAKAGKRVAIVERERFVGGACVYQGTIPSKTLREAALTIAQLKRSANIFDSTLREDLEVASLMDRLSQVLEAHKVFISNHLRDNNIPHIHGRARFVTPHELEVTTVGGGRERYSAATIVIATGSRPRKPPEIPVDHEHILDSDSILSMIYLPRSLTVLGGGVIAAEYASIFALLGVDVTMIDRAPRPLTFMDPELTDQFVASFTGYGGTFLGQKQVAAVRWDGVSQVVCELETGEIINSDKMLVALGRLANVEGLNLEAASVAQGKRGHVIVDKEYRSSVAHIYAVGDVIGPPSLASCSMEQGRRAMCAAFDIDPGHPFELVPIGIYAVPELASVGLDEHQARERYGEIVVGRARFNEVARGQIAGIQDGLLKLVAKAGDQKLLGVQIIGEGATDLIHVGELALVNDNDVNVFLENILNFPTLGEAYRIAALNLLNKLRESPEG